MTPLDFQEAAEQLRGGDFSALSPLFGSAQKPESTECQIIEWLDTGAFADDPEALAEALTCACFLGRTGVAE